MQLVANCHHVWKYIDTLGRPQLGERKISHISWWETWQAYLQLDRPWCRTVGAAAVNGSCWMTMLT